MAEPLTEQQIEDRVEILDGVDAQVCQGCGQTALGRGAADDPAWWIDAALTRGVDGEVIVHAEIICPECW